MSPEQENRFILLMDTAGLPAELARAIVLGVWTEEEGATLPTIGRKERLATVKEVHGFYPTSLRELAEVFSIMSFSDESGGVAKHLAEIATHQNKADADPVKAKIRIVTEFGRFAMDARMDVTNLEQLSIELNTSLQQEPSSVEPLAGTGRGLLVRYLDIQEYALSGYVPEGRPYPLIRSAATKGMIDPKQYRLQSPGPAMRSYVTERLSELKLGQARGLTQEASDDARNRVNFWLDQQKVLVKHGEGDSRILARAVLEKFGVEIDSSSVSMEGVVQ